MNVLADNKGYVIKEQIGAGGFGVVYRAYQPIVEREVAIKVILPQYANHPDFIRRFETEAQLVARLEHPHIVPLYDYWRDPEGAYLVMRYLRGGNLRDSIRQGALALNVAARIIEQIGLALATAHQQGVVHRDLKPANILLDEQGNAYLSDFGIAKALLQAKTQTEESQVVGSPAYLAPEQIKALAVTAAADLYSFGIVIYEMLTGQHPFLGDLTPTALIYKHLEEPLPPLNRPDLPAALDAVIQKATAKDPAARYLDVGSLVSAFRQVHQTGSAGFDESTAITPVTPAPVFNPYKGLRAFQEADSTEFFGREALTQRLVARLCEDHPMARFLAVVGPSGSGKSSVVKAGLIPALRKGALPNSDQWFIAEMLPNTRPLDELEVALLRIAAKQPVGLMEQLQRDQHGLVRAAKLVLPEDGELLLMVDQFEELFMLAEETSQARHFLDLIYTATSEPRCPVRVIITLRADFYDRPLMIPVFCDLVEQRTQVVTPLNAIELERAITCPAERVGVQVEPQLIAAVVSEVGEQIGTLPMLQYALTELFERRSDHSLTLQSYQDLGGVLGVLAQRADEIYHSLTPAQQEPARQVFLRLVTLGEGTEDTRRRTRQSELLAIGHQGISEVLTAFGKARLLTFDREPLTREPTVEVAHEAIIREWKQLRTWLDESRGDMRLQRLLAAASAEWQQSGQDKSYLLSGSRLAQFEEWTAHTQIALTADEKQFLEMSIAEQARQMKLRRRIRNGVFAITTAVALIMAVLALIAFDREQQAQDAREQAIEDRNQAEREAEVNHSLVLANDALRALTAGRTDLALALALEATRIPDPPAEAVRALSYVTSGMGTRAILRDQGNTVRAVAFNSDGTLALSGSCTTLNEESCTAGELIVWELATAAEIQRLEGHTDWVTSVVFNPVMPQMALSASKDGTLILWDVESGTLLRQFEGHQAGVNAVVFSADGQTALSGGDDHTVMLWDVVTGAIVRRFDGLDSVVIAVAFSPDGQIVAAGDGEGTLLLWDTASGELLQSLVGHTAAITALGFRTDIQGQMILFSAGYDLSLREWDIATGVQTHMIPTNDNAASLSLTPDGYTVLECEGNACVNLNLETGTSTYMYIPPSLRPLVFSSAVSTDGRLALIGYDTGELDLINMPATMEIRRFSEAGGLVTVDVSPDGMTLLTGSYSTGTVILWDLRTGQEIRRLEGLQPTILFTLFSPDGHQALIGSSDVIGGTAANRVVLWDVATGEVIHELEGHEYYPRAAAFSPDGRTALIGTLQWGSAWEEECGGELILWDIVTGEEVRRFESPLTVMSVSFSPDGRRALTGASNCGETILWDVARGQQIHTFNYLSLAVSFTADSRYLIVGSEGGYVNLLDAESGAFIRRSVGQALSPYTLDVSADKKFLLMGGWNGYLTLFNFQTGEEIQQLYSSRATVWNVVFSPDGHTAFSASLDTEGDVIEWAISERSLDELLVWVRENRYVQELTCEERDLYHVEPLCKTGTE